MNQSAECSIFWKGEYQLIDSGNKEKLEKYGKYIIRRPEPQALWSPDLSVSEWSTMADASFFKDPKNPEKGLWKLKDKVEERFKVNYPSEHCPLVFRLGFTSFKHIGLFPEQAYNWEYLYQKLSPKKNPKVLNLFAYTGGATVACKKAGAEVTHVDSIKQVVTWAKENLLLSGLDHVRWMIDDAQKFTEREARRGNLYDAVILDPPAYGRGPDGEKWVLEDDLLKLLTNVKQVAHENSTIVINLYSMGLSPELLTTLMRSVFKHDEFTSGELFMKDKFGKNLPLGITYRN